jgi:hypothetical protein
MTGTVPIYAWYLYTYSNHIFLIIVVFRTNYRPMYSVAGFDLTTHTHPSGYVGRQDDIPTFVVPAKSTLLGRTNSQAYL